ncbi:MAG: 23S rRNA (pseudouridine(1915)-N(3))-methyltransferase RlmH [Thermoanaerobaculia bacterium]|nr:23S rRNA (pseudouridine(1915)-N(3))-methyltransferase RlmH [Thermoanaerobaculia bacterium]
MSRELILVWAGRHQRDSWSSLVADYLERIRRWTPIREIVVKVRDERDAATRLRTEAAALLGALPEPVYLVALDRRGEAVSSPELADRLTRVRDEWPHAVAFLLGSDLGLAPELLARARWKWSLGPLTLPHELARLVVAEQVYRALSIGAGIKYHRAPL